MKKEPIISVHAVLTGQLACEACDDVQQDSGVRVRLLCTNCDGGGGFAMNHNGDDELICGACRAEAVAVVLKIRS